MSQIRNNSLRLIWLEAFLAAVDDGSFTAAAKTIGCRQTSITRYVADLELWLGMILFECRYPLTLSAEGKLFVPAARDVVETLYSSRTSEALTAVWVAK